MVKDPLSDFIIQLKNGSSAKKEMVTVGYTKMVAAVADLLAKEGFVKEVSKKGKKVNKFIEVTLRYENKQPAISGVQRVSKLSKRLYTGVKEIRPVKSGFGMLVLTTPKGIVSDKEAKKLNVGGEPLFKIW